MRGSSSRAPRADFLAAVAHAPHARPSRWSHDCLTYGLDCLIYGLYGLIYGLDCLVYDFDCLIDGLDCLIYGLSERGSLSPGCGGPPPARRAPTSSRPSPTPPPEQGKGLFINSQTRPLHANEGNVWGVGCRVKGVGCRV